MAMGWRTMTFPPPVSSTSAGQGGYEDGVTLMELSEINRAHTRRSRHYKSEIVNPGTYDTSLVPCKACLKPGTDTHTRLPSPSETEEVVLLQWLRPHEDG